MLFVARPDWDSTAVPTCEFSWNRSSTPWSTGWTRSAGPSTVCAPAGICRLRMPAISWSEYLGRTASRKARSRQFWIHFRERLTIARGPGPTRKLGFAPTNPSLGQSGPPLRRSSIQRRDGRSGITPKRAPIPAHHPCRGTRCPGHSLGGPQTLPDSQEKAPENLSTAMSAMPSTLEPIGLRRRSRWTTPPGLD